MPYAELLPIHDYALSYERFKHKIVKIRETKKQRAYTITYLRAGYAEGVRPNSLNDDSGESFK